MALIGQAVSEMFENYGHIHVFSKSSEHINEKGDGPYPHLTIVQSLKSEAQSTVRKKSAVGRC